jgi:spermidine/putrescine transport system substrate-binding protein
MSEPVRPVDAAPSRRRFLRAAGGVVAVTVFGPIATACGRDDARAEVVHVANGPGRVDTTVDRDGRVVYPSLQGFARDTGILVDYREVVVDATTFVGQIRPYLAAGAPTGWDVIVVRDGPALDGLRRDGYLRQLPTTGRPNYDDYALATAADRPADPGSRSTMVWRSGMTGLAAPAGSGRLGRLADVFSGRFAGTVGMPGDLVDAPNLAILATGKDPAASRPPDWDRAAELLRRRVEAGSARIVADPVDALRRGLVDVALARSSDVFRANGEGARLDFVVPDEGGLRWDEVMSIPRGAADPDAAIRFMDHVYRPDAAAQIATSGAYLSPVRGTRERLLGLAAREPDEATAGSLRALAASPLVFPSDEDLARLVAVRSLIDEDEAAHWEETFGGFALVAGSPPS